jgi:hypothetical protein
MPTALANAAAAVSAGYIKTQTDFGATANPRYMTVFSKPLTGLEGQSGNELRARGYSNVDAATADTVALAALNNQRLHRYGDAAAGGSKSSTNPTGAALTVDGS